MSLWDSVLDGIVDINTNRSRSLLQMVGIVLGVASVVATFGLIDGGRRKGQEFWDKTGGVRKMFIRELDAREMKQNAQEKKSKGLTYDDAMALAQRGDADRARRADDGAPGAREGAGLREAHGGLGRDSRTTSRCTTSTRPRAAS